MNQLTSLYKPILWISIDENLFTDEKSLNNYKIFLNSATKDYHLLLTWNNEMKQEIELISNESVSEEEFSKKINQLQKAIKNNKEMTITDVKIMLLDEKCMPTKGSEEAACWDIYTREPASIKPDENKLIPLGVRFAIPKGYRIDLRARSSIRKLGVVLPNAVGIIDSDYTGEVMMSLSNITDKEVVIEKYQKIGQMNLQKIDEMSFTLVDDVEKVKKTVRGSNGFGSTGD